MSEPPSPTAPPSGESAEPSPQATIASGWKEIDRPHFLRRTEKRRLLELYIIIVLAILVFFSSRAMRQAAVPPCPVCTIQVSDGRTVTGGGSGDSGRADGNSPAAAQPGPPDQQGSSAPCASAPPLRTRSSDT
jgi:hypothetical protein